MQEEKSNKKEETFDIFYNLTVVNQMDVASKACTFSLAIVCFTHTRSRRECRLTNRKHASVILRACRTKIRFSSECF